MLVSNVNYNVCLSKACIFCKMYVFAQLMPNQLQM